MIARPPIGIGCQLHKLDDGRTVVMGRRGGKGTRADGAYFGASGFSVTRTDEGDVVRMKPAAEEEEIVPYDRLIPWVQTINGITFGPNIGYGSLPSFAHPSHVDWDLANEPDPLVYLPVWGARHEFWVVAEVEGAEIFAGPMFEEESMSINPYNINYIEGVPIVATARLYSSNGGTLIHTVTFEFTPF